MPSERTIYIFFGLIASGKSFLAERFAAERGLPYFNSDRVRKELAGIAATERRPDGIGQGIYTPELSSKTYQTMLERAEESLQNGAVGVILDGSYSIAAGRSEVRRLAESVGARPLFILCSCSEEETERRLELRAKDPNAVSDGRWEIFIRQRETFAQPDELPPEMLLRLNTEAEPEALFRQINPSPRNRK
ncbi:MAG: AAA family ATPase [Candidatus Electronema sp. V4]|uniref:AAA family ATPase n=1 Tax=Candidatus Electronema sp. V4 TaxID=3454756 RepID=UPI0040553764